MFQLPGAQPEEFEAFQNFQVTFFQTAQNQVAHSNVQTFPVPVNRHLVTYKYIYSYSLFIHPSCTSIQLNGFPILLRYFCSYT